MTHLKNTFVVLLAIGAFLLPGTVSTPEASASGPTIIRFASVIPDGSAFTKTMKAWKRSVKELTENRVELRFYSGGSQGDERDFIRKMRVGQMDGAGISTTGLGIVARPMLVLTTPGLITEYEQAERVRTVLADRLAKLFENSGFVALSMGEGGKNRLFAVDEFARPDDLKQGRPWAWKDDPVFAAYLQAIGANAVRFGLPEVYGGLQTGMCDIVPSSAIAAVGLQWYTRLNYMAKDNFGVIVGGALIKKEKYDQLSEHDQKVLMETSVRAGKANDKLIRRDDVRAYEALVKRGMKVVDTSKHKAEWDAVAKKTREALVGRVYSRSLLDAVEKIVAEM